MAHSLPSLIHDARNMVSAMDLYCDLLSEPGVLSPSFAHYAGELRLVSNAGRRLLEELAVAESLSGLEADPPFVPVSVWRPKMYPYASAPSTADVEETAATAASAPILPEPANPHQGNPHQGNRNDPNQDRQDQNRSQDGRDQDSAELAPFQKDWAVAQDPAIEQDRIIEKDRAIARSLLSAPRVRGGRSKVLLDGQPVVSLAEQLYINQNLLSALVGPAVSVSLSVSGGQRPIAMTVDDLTRVLVNLARNAADAMPNGGHLQIALEEVAEFLCLTFTDTGPGIPEASLEAIFSPGFSTRASAGQASSQSLDSPSESTAWPVRHRGLGLSIVRSIVAAAGGSVWAANRNNLTAADISKAGGCASSGEDPAQKNDAGKGAVLVLEFPLIESVGAT